MTVEDLKEYKNIAVRLLRGNGLYATAHACEVVFDKRTPISPNYTDEYMDDAYCPVCWGFEFEYGTTTWELPYCPECGQAILWEDTKENDRG